MLNGKQWIAAVLVASACASQPESAPEVSAASNEQAEAVTQFAFLSPLAEAVTSVERINVAASPEVRLCDWTGAACAPVLAIWTTTSGPAGQVVTAEPGTGIYEVDWKPGQFGLRAGHVYRISVLVGGQEVSHADVRLASDGSVIDVETGARLAVANGRSEPIRFRLDRPGAPVTRLAQRAG